ncbi:MAG TPA: isoprenylcysteine carboxylmethyltransferase family protein [Polyangiaceae bacterium]|nr:isoprenylcysteine carboxylmethyltransferase family protein [Polyangiaceae bacterium]
MRDAPAGLMRKAASGLAQLVVVMGLFIFAPAGTLRFCEGWAFLGLFFGAALAITVFLARKDPALLERRTKAGPVAEKERSQKIIQGVASISFVATMVVPALDHRFGWSRAPLPAVMAGDALVVLGFLVVFLVFRENTYTSSVIEVAAEQRVIDTGPYAVVRHPMYAGALVLVAGIPLALGSLLGLVTLPPFAMVIVWRLLDEERFLAVRLPGYADYCRKVRWRLIPHLW